MNSNTEFETIAKLDLDPIKVKLMHKESGEGWSLAHATMIEGEYRRFLYLMKQYPNEPMAPLFDVDIFWHYHILDTMKYAADSENIFGYFLHHFPYLGLRGEDDEAAHQRVGARMKELYQATFGGHGLDHEVTGADTLTAWSMTVAATDRPYLVSPALATMGTAWSMSSVQNGRFNPVRPAMGIAITAWSMNPAQNDRGYSNRPSLSAATTAWSMSPAQDNTGYPARPVLDTATTAWSMSPAQHNGACLVRPALENAA